MVKINNIAKTLRGRSTDTEKILWKYLRANRFEGLKFRRQEPIGNYIVDFVCYEKKIVIEVDGGHHLKGKENDRRRDDWLKEQGFRVIRFWNNEVLTNIEGVLEVIKWNCYQIYPSPLSSPTSGEDK